MSELAPTPMPSASPTLPHLPNKTFRRQSSHLFDDNLSTTSFNSPASSELQPASKTEPLRKISTGSSRLATASSLKNVGAVQQLQPDVEKTQPDIDTIETATVTTTNAEQKPRKKSFFGKVLRSLSSKTTAANDDVAAATDEEKKKAKKEKQKKLKKNDAVDDEKIAAGSVLSAAQSTVTTKSSQPHVSFAAAAAAAEQQEEKENDSDQHNLYSNQPARYRHINNNTIYDAKRANHVQQYSEGGKSTFAAAKSGDSSGIINTSDFLRESEKHKQTNLSSLTEVEEAATNELVSNEATLLPSMLRKDVRHTPASLKIHAKLVDEFRARFQQQQQQVGFDRAEDGDGLYAEKHVEAEEKLTDFSKHRGVKARPVMMQISSGGAEKSPQHREDNDSGINEKSPTNSSRSSSSVQTTTPRHVKAVEEAQPKLQAAEITSGASAFRFQPVFAEENVSTSTTQSSSAAAAKTNVGDAIVSAATSVVDADGKSSKKKKSLASRLLSSIVRRGGKDKNKSSKSQKAVAAADAPKIKDEAKITEDDTGNTDTLVRKATSSVISSSTDQRPTSYIATADITNESPPIDTETDEEEYPQTTKAPAAPIRRQSTKLSHAVDAAVEEEKVPEKHQIFIEQLTRSPALTKKIRNRTGSSSSGCVRSEDGGAASSSNNHVDDEEDVGNGEVEKVAPSASPSAISVTESGRASNTKTEGSKNNATAASSSSGMSDGVATPEPTTLISTNDSGYKSRTKAEQKRNLRRNNINNSTSDNTAMQSSPSTLACEDEEEDDDEERRDEVYENEDDDDGVDLDGSSSGNGKSAVPSLLLQRRGSMRKAREDADITTTTLEQLQQQVNGSNNNLQRRSSKRASIRKKRAKKQQQSSIAAQKPSANAAVDKAAKCMTLPPLQHQTSLLHKPTPVRLYSTNLQQQQSYCNINNFTPQQSGCSPAVEHLIATGLRTAAADANASRNWINSLRRPTPIVLNSTSRQQSVPASMVNNPFSPNWQAPMTTASTNAQSQLNFNYNNHPHTIERPRSCVSGRLLMEQNSIVDQQRTLTNARLRRRSERFKTVELSPTTLLAASSAMDNGERSVLRSAVMAVEIV